MKLSIQARVRFWRLADRIISRKGTVFERGRLDAHGNFANNIDSKEASKRVGSSNAKQAPCNWLSPRHLWLLSATIHHCSVPLLQLSNMKLNDSRQSLTSDRWTVTAEFFVLPRCA